MFSSSCLTIAAKKYSELHGAQGGQKKEKKEKPEKQQQPKQEKKQKPKVGVIQVSCLPVYARRAAFLSLPAHRFSIGFKP